MFGTHAQAVVRRSSWIVGGLMLAVLSAMPAQAQAQTATPEQLFPDDAGLVLQFIKPESVAAYEEVMAKLKEALQKSESPERKQQAATWKLFKSPQPAGANVLYVFMIDPSVKGADYTVMTILSEAFPTEVNDLYKKYAESFAQGMNVVNLQLVQNFGN